MVEIVAADPNTSAGGQVPRAAGAVGTLPMLDAPHPAAGFITAAAAMAAVTVAAWAASAVLARHPALAEPQWQPGPVMIKHPRRRWR